MTDPEAPVNEAKSPTTPPIQPDTATLESGLPASGGRVTRYIELDEDTPCFLRYATFMCRIFGVILSGALWGTSIKTLEYYKANIFIGWYLLGAAIIVTFLELMWLINKCICCANDRGCCCCFWRGLLWIDCWRKTILYAVASIPCFIKTVLLGIICGVLLLVAATLYFIKSFKYCRCTKKTHRQASYMEVSSPQVSLVQHEVTQPTEPGENTVSNDEKARDVPNDMNTSYQKYDHGKIVPE